MSNLKMFKYEWIWDTVSPCGHLNVKIRPMLRSASILIFGKHPCYNPQGLVYNPRVKSRRSTSQGSQNYGKHNDVNISEYQGYPTNIIKYKRECGLHPTQKPVALFEYLIKTYTNPGDLVLDNCAGSGTTPVACIKTDRNFIGFEWSPVEPHDLYFKPALERIKNEQLQTRIKFS